MLPLPLPPLKDTHSVWDIYSVILSAKDPFALRNASTPLDHLNRWYVGHTRCIPTPKFIYGYAYKRSGHCHYVFGTLEMGDGCLGTSSPDPIKLFREL